MTTALVGYAKLTLLGLVLYKSLANDINHFDRYFYRMLLLILTVDYFA